jgi:hypothetical protein
MSIRTASNKQTLCVILGLFLIVSVASARSFGQNEYSDFSRFSLSLGGGFGFTEGHQGMLDLKTELQYGLTSRIRFGLGIGYLNSAGRHGFDEDWYGEREHMTPELDGEEITAVEIGQDMSREQIDREAHIRGYRQDFRIIPLSLNVYYNLPLARRWIAFAGGGGSYYFGSFRTMNEQQDKNGWGGQGGLGFEFRLTERLRLVAEGTYRFAKFHGVDLNGFSFRASAKFGF